jgi:hypothetical protein
MTQTLIFPLLTTAERDALPSVPDGSTIFNVDVDNLQVTKNNGATWENLVDSSTSSSPTEVYVSNTGNDTPDAGTIGNPYETLTYALSQITDASSSKPYTIFLVTGVYNEPSLALKAWVNIDGQNSNLTITNPVSADPSFNGGSISRIYNFADLNFVGGANLDFTLSTSIVALRFEDILSSAPYTITIQGSSFGTALIVNNWVPLGPEPSLILENTLCLIDNFNLNGLTVEKTNVASGIGININNSQIRGSALFDCSQNQMVLTIKDVNFLGAATYLQTGTGVLSATSVNSFYSSLVVDGLKATLNIDQIEALPSVLNGATVNYKLISDGLLSNYTPLNYTPTSTSVNGALQGIDAAIGNISVSTLQEAYDAGPTINQSAGVDLEVFSSTGRLGFSVIENGNTTGVQVNRALQIDYPDIGGPLLFFQHLTPTGPGNLIASIGGQTQANNGFSKSYQSMLVQVVNDTDAAFEAETVFANIINNAQTNCFKTGTQNVSFRNLNMQSNNIDEVNQINGNLAAGYLNMGLTLLELRAATRLDLVTTAGLINIAAGDINIESENITTANTVAGSTINTTMENYQLPVNFNTSLIDSHYAYDSSNSLQEYYREDIITSNVTSGSVTGQKNFWVSENGSLLQYLRLNGIGQINMFKPLDMGSNDISVIRTIQGSSGYIDFQNFISATAFEIKALGTQDLDLFVTSGDININGDAAGLININNTDLNLNQNGIVNVGSINGLTPQGGLSAGTSNSAILTASTSEQSILSATFVGNRQAPANSFKQGDTFVAVLAGNFSANNGDTLTLRLKGGASGTTILSSIVIPLNNAVGTYFELEIDFVIRQIGAATVADIVANYDFSYNQSSGGNFQGERKCEVNNTTFDTTNLNQLDITAQFSSASASNSIETLLSSLGKTY